MGLITYGIHTLIYVFEQVGMNPNGLGPTQLLDRSIGVSNKPKNKDS